MRGFNKILVIMLAVMMTATTVLPYASGGLFAYANGDTAVAEEQKEDRAVGEEATADESAGSDEDAAKAVTGEAEETAKTDKVEETKPSDDKNAKEENKAPEKNGPVELTFEGKDFDVSVSGDEKSGLTKDTGLEVTEVEKKGKETSKEYKEYMSLYESALDKVDGNKAVFAKFYDITLTDADGAETEPNADVDVSFKFSEKLAKELKVEDASKLSIVHFVGDAESGKVKAEILGTDKDKANNGVAVIDGESGKTEQISTSKNGETPIELTVKDEQLQGVAFTASSFSVYGIIYTVDFHYGDGEYDFSIDGESSILLSEVFERLYIEDIDMADIESVEFSDPELIKVEKASEAIEAEDEAAAEAAKAAEDPDHDWLLTSLKAFDTDETLNITMTDGSKLTINVTDAQHPTADGATFKLELPAAATVNRVTYWDTWEEVVQKANDVHSDNGNNKITVLRDCDVFAPTSEVSFDPVNFRMTIDGGNHKITLKGNWSQDFIIWKKEASANVLTINNLVIDGTSASGNEGFVHNLTEAGNRASNIVISDCEFIRGGMTGNLIDAGTKSLSISNTTIDGSNTQVNSNLILTSAENNNTALSMSNITVKNHNASSAGKYAIDATSVTANNGVKISGDLSIVGNTANGKPANLAVSGTNKLHVSADAYGNAGITNNDNSTIGSTFGAKAGTATVYALLSNDLSTSQLIGVVSGNSIKWQTVDFDPHITNAVAKMTDSDGNMLLHLTSSSYKYAVYTSLDNAISGVNEQLFQYDEENGLRRYSGPVNIEILVDNITRASAITLNRPNQNITFKSASKDDELYPYSGSNEKTMLKFTNAGERFVFQGGGSIYSFENIIIDGSDIEAQEGGLIKVGDRGASSEYYATVVLKNGAVLQYGRTNNHDQGGGLYVGKGCKLYMEPGSVIKYCQSSHGTVIDATGGAIYLAEGEFYCDGGVIENCKSVGGGAVDLGGATDGTGSDEARIYLSGSPQIISNTNNSGNAMNLHLNYDSNEVIQIVGNMTDDARIGVSVNTKPSIFNNHGVEGTPFATIATGVSVNPGSFVNDRDTKLTAMISTTNPNLLVWYYPLIINAVDDYYIDGTKIKTTTLAADQYFTLDNTKSYTTESLSSEFLSVKEIDLYKNSNFDYIEAASNTGVDGTVYPAITSGITNLRFVDAGNYGGRRWQISKDNGSTWEDLKGRKLTIHYKRECRDNAELVKIEDTNALESLSGAKFKLERSYPTAGNWSVYTNGAGHTTSTSSGDIADTSANGIYTTDANGKFIMNLPEGYYRLTETEAADGYDKINYPITFHVNVDAVPDTPANSERLVCTVDNVSPSENYSGDADYNTWSSTKILGTFTVGDPRKVPMHVLVQKGVDEYELADSLRTTEFVTAPLGTTTEIENTLNPAPTGYTNYHIYYGSQNQDDTYNLIKEDVTSLKGTQNGIIVNNSSSNVLTKDQAIYFVLYQNPRTVPYHILVNNNGTLTERSDWATTGSNRTTKAFTVNESGIQVDNAYGDKTEGGKTYRLVGVLYSDTQPASVSDGTALKWLVNTPDAVVARNSKTSQDIGTLTSSSEVYFIYSAGADLTISKQASGDYADLTRDYAFSITLPEKSGGYTAKKTDKNGNETEMPLGTRGGNFTLKTGENIVIKQIETGQQITVTENGIGDGTADGETGNYKVTPTFEDPAKVSDIAVSPDSTKTDGSSVSFKLNDDAALTFSNYLNGIVPSGIFSGPGLALIVAFLLLMAVLARLIFMIRRRKAMTRR